jgi:hypothetical protein
MVAAGFLLGGIRVEFGEGDPDLVLVRRVPILLAVLHGDLPFGRASNEVVRRLVVAVEVLGGFHAARRGGGGAVICAGRREAWHASRHRTFIRSQPIRSEIGTA